MIFAPGLKRGGSGGNDIFTTLLLHCDGTNGSTSIIDSSPSTHLMTPAGAAAISTSNVKFGSGSLLLGSADAVTTGLSADWDFGSFDFTLDFWVRHTSLNSPFLNNYISAGNWLLSYDPQNHHIVWSDQVNSISLNGASMATGSYAHVAVVRQNDNLVIYKNGAATAAQSGYAGLAVNSDDASPLTIGAQFIGNLDEIRVSKGIARWTANFTPPNNPYN